MSDGEKADEIVYISCDEEAQYSFASHLSEALRRKGIKHFIDCDYPLSEESRALVQRGKVSVMLLPGNREPTTTTCLGKLEQILDCHRNNEQVVVPVLYGIRTFQDKWLRELKHMRGLSSFEQSRMGWSDSSLVKETVRHVYEKLFSAGRIGIFKKLLEIENMVCKQPSGIRCVGIWGMPGIGKTTLAEAVFDQMFGSFDACCFIQDCDKVIREKGLYHLLEEQFLKEEPGVGGTIMKLSLLRDKLNKKRVLVVLDNVCNHLVAESFLGGFNWFGSKSLIIITSRDKQVFRLCRVNQVYEVQGLHKNEALQLFALSESRKDAELNLLELSMKVIEYVNGNPLALKEYGRELKRRKNLSEMETAFFKLEWRPANEIFYALKSSYDTLTDSEKNIFLDIACFFQGENIEYVSQLFEGCGFSPHVGIDVLVEKCLVTISENRVCMQNLIKDFGRKIVTGEIRSRVWEPGLIKDFLEDNRAEGTEKIEGIFMETSYLSLDVKPAAFQNMLNLRLLKIYSSNPYIHPEINFSNGCLQFLPTELRLLHWENYPLESLPPNFDPRHLVEINMPYSQLQKLWDGNKNLEKLRTIRLCHSQQLVDIEDLSKAQNLEVIDLQGCTRLTSFPATGKLLHLRVVNLSGCTEIKSFTEVPPNIETLQLQGTSIVSLFSVMPNRPAEQVNISDFQGLSDASILERITSLLKSSSSCQDLPKLICLELKGCSCLQSLPNMVNLELLPVLDLSGCSKLETIQGFPRNLKELYIVGTAVREVSQLPQSLEQFRARRCLRLRSLPNMVNMELLQVLDLSICSELETIQGFPQNLKELYIAGTAVREVSQLPQGLEIFSAHGCVYLKSILLDSENLPMHCTLSNCFNLSPQVVNNILGRVLDNVNHMPRERQQELNRAPFFTFCAPSHAYQNSTLDLQGSSLMTQLNPSWRNTLVGFALLVEVAFPEDYCDDTGFGISCVCRWKNKEGHSHIIERNLHCWAPGEAFHKDHMFVFCDVSMRPSTDSDIWADLIVFEFFPIDSYTVTRCGVSVITTGTGNTSLEHITPELPLVPKFSGNEVEEVSRVSYDGLEERNKALFLYIACLFNDEDAGLVAPLVARIDFDITTALKDLANTSLIGLLSNGNIVMHRSQRILGKEILHKQSVPPDSSKDLTTDFKKVSLASVSPHNLKYDVYPSFSGQDVCTNFLSRLFIAFERNFITTFKDSEVEQGQRSIPFLVQRIRESKTVIVVFSKNYASSTWLLNELVEIARRNEEVSQIVIPIYYDVDPLDVRNQTGEFGRQFKQTCKNKAEDEKQRYCRALTNITDLHGLKFKNCDQSKDEFIESVVKDVKRMVATIPTTEGKESNSSENPKNWFSGSSYVPTKSIPHYAKDSYSSLKGIELGKLVLSSGLLQSSWSKISELQKLTYPNQDTALGIKIHKIEKYTLVVFAAPPVSSINDSDATLLPGSQNPNPFQFLCSEKISEFSVHTRAYKLFSSAYKELSDLKAELLEAKKPVIITGAALGGSVASLFTLWLLETIDPIFKRPLCITFGSPLVGDASLQQILEDSVRNSCFLHVAQPKSRVKGDFKPFGRFLICYDSECICIEDPEAVMELLTGANADPEDYGRILDRLDQSVLSMADSRLMIDDVIDRMKERAEKKKPRFNPSKKLNDMKISMMYLDWYKKESKKDKKESKKAKMGYYDRFKTKTGSPF